MSYLNVLKKAAVLRVRFTPLIMITSIFLSGCSLSGGGEEYCNYADVNSSEFDLDKLTSQQIQQCNSRFYERSYGYSTTSAQNNANYSRFIMQQQQLQFQKQSLLYQRMYINDKLLLNQKNRELQLKIEALEKNEQQLKREIEEIKNQEYTLPKESSPPSIDEKLDKGHQVSTTEEPINTSESDRLASEQAALAAAEASREAERLASEQAALAEAEAAREAERLASEQAALAEAEAAREAERLASEQAALAAAEASREAERLASEQAALAAAEASREAERLASEQAALAEAEAAREAERLASEQAALAAAEAAREAERLALEQAAQAEAEAAKIAE